MFPACRAGPCLETEAILKLGVSAIAQVVLEAGEHSCDVIDD